MAVAKSKGVDRRKVSPPPALYFPLPFLVSPSLLGEVRAQIFPLIPSLQFSPNFSPVSLPLLLPPASSKVGMIGSVNRLTKPF